MHSRSPSACLAAPTALGLSPASRLGCRRDQASRMGLNGLARRRGFGRHVHRCLPVRGRVAAGSRSGRSPPRRTIPRAASPEGVAEGMARVGAAPEAVAYFGHGTTVATNALIQQSRRAHRADHHRRASATCWRSAGRSAPTSTTCRRTSRPCWCRATCAWRCRSGCATTARWRRRSTRTRCARAVRALRDAGVQAVAVCFLYSFLRPEHEAARRARILAEEFPEAFACVSHASRRSSASSSASPPRW